MQCAATSKTLKPLAGRSSTIRRTSRCRLPTSRQPPSSSTTLAQRHSSTSGLRSQRVSLIPTSISRWPNGDLALTVTSRTISLISKLWEQAPTNPSTSSTSPIAEATTTKALPTSSTATRAPSGVVASQAETRVRPQTVPTSSSRLHVQWLPPTTSSLRPTIQVAIPTVTGSSGKSMA